ncbi:MAG TPA: hypothetical protein DD670_10260 [Planctomycetaceae bacterium]|nr:hypothetical protein [Planctomycetaceae bacterium]
MGNRLVGGNYGRFELEAKDPRGRENDGLYPGWSGLGGTSTMLVGYVDTLWLTGYTEAARFVG